MFAATTRFYVTLALVVGISSVGMAQNRTTAVGKQPGGYRNSYVKGSVHRGQRTNPSTRSGGLLGRIFGGSGRQKSNQPAASIHEEDWTDVPYHEVNRPRSTGGPTPMRDPSSTAIGSGVSNRLSIADRTRPGAKSNRYERRRRIPTPPTEVTRLGEDDENEAQDSEEITSIAERPEFSSTYSSRRNRRRSVPTFRAPEKSISRAPQRSSTTSPKTVNEVEPPKVPHRRLPLRSTPSKRSEKPSNTLKPLPHVPSLQDSSAVSRQKEVTIRTPLAKTPIAGLSSSLKTNSQPTPSRVSTSNTPFVLKKKTIEPSPKKSAISKSAPSAYPAAIWNSVSPKREFSVSPPSIAPFGRSKNQVEVVSDYPQIRVIAKGPDKMLVRQESLYEISVENRGTTTAPGVVVRTNLPNWMQGGEKSVSSGVVTKIAQTNFREFTWKIDGLTPGSTERLVLALTPQKAEKFAFGVEWVPVVKKEQMLVQVQEPKLQLAIEGPDQVVYGRKAMYTFRFSNPGSAAASNVVLKLSPGSDKRIAHPVGTILAGDEKSLKVEVTPPAKSGDFEVLGSATGDLGLKAQRRKKIRIAIAKLDTTLIGPSLMYQNTTATYQLRLKNTGQIPSENVIAKLRLPSGVQYKGGIKGAKINDGVLQWKIGRFDANTQQNYKFQCKMTATGPQQFAFSCGGTAAGKTSVTFDTDVRAIADLVLSINDPRAPAPVNDDVVYEIMIKNRGSKAANNVQVLSHFSPNIEPVRVEGLQGVMERGSVRFQKISKIQAGQEIKLRLTARASKEGLHRFTTEVTSGEIVLFAEEATRYVNMQTEQISRHSDEAKR